MTMKEFFIKKLAKSTQSQQCKGEDMDRLIAAVKKALDPQATKSSLEEKVNKALGIERKSDTSSVTKSSLEEKVSAAIKAQHQ